jgi:hypothetical protein
VPTKLGLPCSIVALSLAHVLGFVKYDPMGSMDSKN